MVTAKDEQIETNQQQSLVEMRWDIVFRTWLGLVDSHTTAHHVTGDGRTNWLWLGYHGNSYL